MIQLEGDLKRILQKAKKWPEFVALRNVLESQGFSHADATAQASEKLIPDPFESNPGESNDPAKETVVVETSDSAKTSLDAKCGSADSFSKESQRKVKGPSADSSPLTLPPLELASFGEKQATEVETIRWVSRNMAIRDPDPDTCPDASAWALLAHCRKVPAAANEFWKTTYTKLLPTRTQMEAQKGEKDVDGSKTLEIIDDLLKIGKEAIKQCGAC